jgi:hypothetical protein
MVDAALADGLAGCTRRGYVRPGFGSTLTMVHSLSVRCATAATAMGLASGVVGVDVAAAAPDLVVTRLSKPPAQVGVGRSLAVTDVRDVGALSSAQRVLFETRVLGSR